MTSLTEQVIRDQFDFLSASLRQPFQLVQAPILVFVGCGTSYYLASSIAAASNASGQPAIAVTGAEWAQRPQWYLADGDGAMVIGLSRSGTTTETIQALEASRAAGQTTVAISCENGSGILKAADHAIYLPTDDREGIVMTVSASLMLLNGFRLVGVPLSESVLEDAAKILSGLDELAAGSFTTRSHFVTLGAGPLYGIAAEASLKLQEMSLSHAQAFHPMEYRHGPISLIDEGSVVTILYSTDTADQEALVAADVQAKGAKVIGIGGPGDITIPVATTGAAAALAILPALQLFGEKIACAKNLDTETPRHLTKVVVLN